MDFRNSRVSLPFFALASVVLAVAWLGGCAAEGPSGSPTTTPSLATAGPVAAGDGHPAHAECLVCKHNADLACVDLDVDGKTPAYTYGGRNYYFCSDKCRNEFARNPAKFVKE